jgi:hypothetical protein
LAQIGHILKLGVWFISLYKKPTFGASLLSEDHKLLINCVSIRLRANPLNRFLILKGIMATPFKKLLQSVTITYFATFSFAYADGGSGGGASNGGINSISGAGGVGGAAAQNAGAGGGGAGITGGAGGVGCLVISGGCNAGDAGGAGGSTAGANGGSGVMNIGNNN